MIQLKYRKLVNFWKTSFRKRNSFESYFHNAKCLLGMLLYFLSLRDIKLNLLEIKIKLRTSLPACLCVYGDMLVSLEKRTLEAKETTFLQQQVYSMNIVYRRVGITVAKVLVVINVFLCKALSGIDSIERMMWMEICEACSKRHATLIY